MCAVRRMEVENLRSVQGVRAPFAEPLENILVFELSLDFEKNANWSITMDTGKFWLAKGSQENDAAPQDG